jgi:chromosomal replication initiator protein
MDFVAALEKALVDCIGSQRFQLWFRNRTTFVLDGDALVVGVPNLHLQEWLKKEYAESVRAAALSVLNRPVEICFRVDAELFRTNRQELKQAGGPVPLQEVPKPPPTQRTLFDGLENKLARQRARLEQPKRRWRNLAEFVVGPCNRVAYAAALSIAEEPGQGPNPLVVHGPVGTGKTHLLEGIYGSVRRRHPQQRVVYVTAEDFTNRFVTSVRFGKQLAFRKHFRACDVLLIDDVHFLARKRATQEEFLHTLDAMLDDGRQVVLSSDCHPRLNEDFQPELLDRLLGGAIWGLLPPDADTRLAFLRSQTGQERNRPEENRARVLHAFIPDEVLGFLAQQLRGNMRELEGALHSIRHFSRVTNRPMDLALAREALGELLRHAVRTVRVADVDGAVCGMLQLPSGTLQSKQRNWSVSHPRMLAIYLCRKHTAASFGEISKHFGSKSHSTTVAAEKKIRKSLEGNGSLTAGGREWPVRELIERIERKLLG